MQAMRNMTPGQFEALAQQEFTAGQAPTAQQLSRTAAQLKVGACTWGLSLHRYET